MLDLTPLTDRFGDAGAAVVVGALIGLLFGVFAQQSRFCLRAAIADTAQGSDRGRLGIWLLALGAGLAATQGFIGWDLIDTFAVRPLNEAPSLSGAIAGGLLFGAGMVLANGCASRHLVLAGTGNMRAAIGFALFTMTASATITGPLAPLQQAIAGAWRLDAGASHALAVTGQGPSAGVAAGLVVLIIGLALAVRARQPLRRLAMGAGVGLVIALGWLLTTALSRHTFDPTPVESTAFTAPAAHAAALITSPGEAVWSFDTGFLPAVLAGAFLAASLSREVRFEWFGSLAAALQYMAGAVLMGFGGVLATGCSVGSLANATVMISASLIALAAMWAGGFATKCLTGVDWPRLLATSRAQATRPETGLIAHQVAK
jgi:uncharacterized membrane protein YedE/YeeE